MKIAEERQKAGAWETMAEKRSCGIFRGAKRSEERAVSSGAASGEIPRARAPSVRASGKLW